MGYEVPGEATESNWHDYEAVAFVPEDTLETVYEDGTLLVCEPEVGGRTAFAVLCTARGIRTTAPSSDSASGGLT